MSHSGRLCSASSIFIHLSRVYEKKTLFSHPSLLDKYRPYSQQRVTFLSRHHFSAERHHHHHHHAKMDDAFLANLAPGAVQVLADLAKYAAEGGAPIAAPTPTPADDRT